MLRHPEKGQMYKLVRQVGSDNCGFVFSARRFLHFCESPFIKLDGVFT